MDIATTSTSGDARATVPPLAARTEEEFWAKVRKGEEQIARGQCRDAYEVLAELRARYGL